MTFKAGHLVDPNDPNSVSEVRELTPALVMDDVRARDALIDNDGVDRLYGKSEPYRIGPGTSFRSWSGTTPNSCFRRKPTPSARGDRTSHWGHRLGHSGLCRISHWIHPVSVHGLLKVAGLTELQARNLIVNSSSKYIQDPQITVRVLGYRSKRVYVEGEVKTPGALAINDIPMTLMEAVNRAGASWRRAIAAACMSSAKAAARASICRL